MNHHWKMCEIGTVFKIANINYISSQTQTKICLKCNQQAYSVDENRWFACDVDFYHARLLPCEEFIIKNIIE